MGNGKSKDVVDNIHELKVEKDDGIEYNSENESENSLQRLLNLKSKIYTDNVVFEDLVFITMKYDIYAFNYKKEKIYRVFKGHTNYIKKILVHTDGHLYTFSTDYTLRKWDIDLGICLTCLLIPFNNFPSHVVVLENESVVMAVNNKLVLFKEIKLFLSLEEMNNGYEIIHQAETDITHLINVGNSLVFVVNKHPGKDLYIMNLRTRNAELIWEKLKIIHLHTLSETKFAIIHVMNLTYAQILMDIDGEIINDEMQFQNCIRYFPLDYGYFMYRKSEKYHFYNVKNGTESVIKFPIGTDISFSIFSNNELINYTFKKIYDNFCGDYRLYSTKFLNNSQFDNNTIIYKYPIQIRGKKGLIYERIQQKNKLLDIKFSFRTSH